MDAPRHLRIPRGADRHRSVPRPLLLLPLLAGCALFEPRGSEPPLDTDPVDWRPPRTPDAVLANLDAVVEALDPALYEELLADSAWALPFQFSGDPAASGGDTRWGLEEELQIWQALTDQHHGAAAEPRLSLTRTDSLFAGDSASYTADYLLDLADSRYAGTLRLTLSRSLRTGDWAIHHWEDWGADSLSSWTQLKQGFLWR
jgi:hypothetical protein